MSTGRNNVGTKVDRAHCTPWISEGYEPGFVSVIIPTYNRAECTSGAVLSALMQTHENLEVVVVDDASDDVDLLEDSLSALNDPRVRLIKHKANKNGAAARNTGVRASTGHWIAFLDSDDEWYDDKLEKQLELVRNRQANEVLCYCRSSVITKVGDTEKETVMPGRSIAADESMSDYLFCNRGYLPTPSIILSRELALKYPFNEELERHQDYDLMLRLGHAGIKFLMHPETLVKVHWEDIHSTCRGLNPFRSMEFLDEYKIYMNPKSQTSFVLQQIVFQLLRVGKRRKALGVLQKRASWKLMGFVEVLTLLSLFLFADDRLLAIPVWVKKCAKRLRQAFNNKQ